jgi:hypothetical protein
MTRLIVAGVLVVAHAVSLQSQERPNYSGTWVLVDDRSVAPGAPRLGKEFKVTQSPTTVSIETTAMVSSGSVAPGGGVMVTERKEVKVSIDYITDGAEHDEVLPSAIPGVGPVPAGATVSSPAPSIYRATWLNGQSLVLKYSKLPSENNALMSVSRLALSLDADGSLVVDSLSLPMRPRANGPKQEPPASVRSIYKKAQ